MISEMNELIIKKVTAMNKSKAGVWMLISSLTLLLFHHPFFSGSSIIIASLHLDRVDPKVVLSWKILFPLQMSLALEL